MDLIQKTSKHIHIDRKDLSNRAGIHLQYLEGCLTRDTSELRGNSTFELGEKVDGTIVAQDTICAT